MPDLSTSKGSRFVEMLLLCPISRVAPLQMQPVKA